MSNLDPYPLPAIRIVPPVGVTVLVSITNSAGTPSVYADPYAVTPITMPCSVSVVTALYMTEGLWTVSCKSNGTELAGVSIVLEDAQVADVTCRTPVSVSASNSVLALYGISALTTSWVASGNTGQKVLTFSGGHDFQVGHGIRVYGALGAGNGGSTPATPTISQGGTPGSTALLFYAGTAGTSFNVLPVVLNVNTGLTTSTALECRITYCISPLGA